MVHLKSVGRVVRIVFDTPQDKNKLSIKTVSALRDMVASLPDRSIDAVSIESSAPDIFAAGADIEELSALTEETAGEFSRNGQSLMAAIAGLPMPVFCLVSGPCFGGALDLALACDYVFASINATFRHPGVRLGIITGWGGSVRLVERLGQAAARFMLLTGQVLNASQAHRVGLVDELCDSHAELKHKFDCATAQLERWPKRGR